VEHSRHVFRIFLVLIIAIGAFLLGRGFLVPDSYGRYGRYRYDNVKEQMAVRPPSHAGPAACAECHAAQATKRAAGAHKAVSCEVCHGPLGDHVTAGKVTGKAQVQRTYTLCALCHRKIAGRPEKFPQVVLDQHVAMVGEKLEGAVCLSCHDPHSPKP
jgi:hypothetical protein